MTLLTTILELFPSNIWSLQTQLFLFPVLGNEFYLSRPTLLFKGLIQLENSRRTVYLPISRKQQETAMLHQSTPYVYSPNEASNPTRLTEQEMCELGFEPTTSRFGRGTCEVEFEPTTRRFRSVWIDSCVKTTSQTDILQSCEIEQLTSRFSSLF